MTNLEKLVSLGAYSCGGELLYKNKSLGQLRNNDFFPSPEGLALLEQDISDVEVKTETKRRGRPAADQTPPSEVTPSETQAT